jgi:hypothetical protein
MKHIDGVPRHMTRISNIYNIARCLVVTASLGQNDNFIKKILKVTILCEQWPYQMSLLMQMVEGSLRKYLLQIQNISDPFPVSMKCENLEIKFVSNHANYEQNTILYEMISKEKKNIRDLRQSILEKLDGNTENIEKTATEIRNLNKKLDEDEKFVKDFVAFSQDMNKAFSYWEETRNVSQIKWKQRISNIENVLESAKYKKSSIGKGIKSIHNDLREEIKELVENIKEDFEKQLKEHFSQLRLFDVFCRMEEKMLQISENEQNKHSLSCDGDYHIFKQLLVEDRYNDGCLLKAIDFALPSQFSNKENNDYISLRPFIINLSRHMLERASKLHESLKNKTS